MENLKKQHKGFYVNVWKIAQFNFKELLNNIGQNKKGGMAMVKKIIVLKGKVGYGILCLAFILLFFIKVSDAAEKGSNAIHLKFGTHIHESQPSAC